jgi:uncharacterized protein (TIGR04222 family)
VNPFLWSGPQFLVFYLALAVVVVAACWIWNRLGPAKPPLPVTELTSDPYRIACLRGGPYEAVRVAIFNLVDRGLLKLKSGGPEVLAARGDATEFLRRPLDQAIIRTAARATTADLIMHAQPVRDVARRYGEELKQRGLFANDAEMRRRRTLVIPAFVILAAFAAGKIGYAVSQGRSNVWFLAFLWLAATLFVVGVYFSSYTRAGREALATVQALTGRLKSRAPTLKSGGGTNEALLLASAFGLAALPTTMFAFMEELFPRPKPTSNDGGGDGDGGSSCSSGCGGGGGCGGCGG